MLLLKDYAIRWSLLAGLVALLGGCSGNTLLEGKLAPDPNLKETPQTVASPSPTSPQTDNLPPEIPRYPQAQLLSVESNSNNDSGSSRWQSPDPTNLIESYYQQQFTGNNWQITQAFTPDEQNNNTIMARREDLEVKVTVIPSSNMTDVVIQYQKGTPSVSSTPNASPTPNQTLSANFADLDQVPESLRPYIQDLATLGVLTSQSQDKFNPHGNITRREFARWLFEGNNKIFANAPDKQIRPAANNAQPAFTDIKPQDPDFAIIQGLAEAGLIPSRLTGDNNALLFRPDAPLIREDLITWKVPIDTRKALPSASIDSVKQTWGFQDTPKISPLGLRSLYADYQNGDQSNVKRVFGYTTLFQPKKPVTRSEAAIALWYFGQPGEGMSAQDALQVKNATPTNSPG